MAAIEKVLDDVDKSLWCEDSKWCGWNKQATLGGRTEWYVYLCQACHTCKCNNVGWIDVHGGFTHMHYFSERKKYVAISGYAS